MQGVREELHLRDSQRIGKENRDKGNRFQDEVRRSVLRLPKVCRFRQKDSGNEGPADDLLLLPSGLRVLNEIKTTEKHYITLRAFKLPQITGMLDFVTTDPRWNISVTTIRFEEVGLVFVVSWIKFLGLMKTLKRSYLTVCEVGSIGQSVPQIPNSEPCLWDFSQVWPFKEVEHDEHKGI